MYFFALSPLPSRVYLICDSDILPKRKMLAVFPRVGFETRNEKRERATASIVLPLRSLKSLLVPKGGKTGYRRDRGLYWDLIYTR